MKSYLSASAVWGFVQKNKDRLEHEMAMIAENEETSYSICVTVENGICKVVAFRGDMQVYSEGCVDEDDCRDVCVNAVFRYLIPYTENVGKLNEFLGDEPEKPGTDATKDDPDEIADLESLIVVVDDDADDPDFGKLMDACHDQIEVTDQNRKSVQDVCELREDDLIQATRDYLDILLEQPAILDLAVTGDEILQDFLDAAAYWLAEQKGLSTWYPIILPGDDGDILVPYPYDEAAAMAEDPVCTE